MEKKFDLNQPRNFFKSHRCIPPNFIILLIFLATTFSSLIAQEGYLNLSFRNRSHIFGPSEIYPLSENEYESIWHLDLFQKTFNYGQFYGWFDGRLFDSTLQAAHWFLKWQDFKLGPLSASFNLGDYNFQFTTLGYRFTNYYPAFNYLRGFTSRISHPKFSFNFFSGRVARLSGLMGLVYSLTDQTATGFLAHFQPGNRYYFGLGFLHSENEKDWAGNLVTRSNNLFLLESEVKINERIKLVAESKTSVATIEKTPDKMIGHSLRFGSFFNFERWLLEVNYRRVEADFRGIRSDFTLDHGSGRAFHKFPLSTWKRTLSFWYP